MTNIERGYRGLPIGQLESGAVRKSAAAMSHAYEYLIHVHPAAPTHAAQRSAAT